MGTISGTFPCPECCVKCCLCNGLFPSGTQNLCFSNVSTATVTFPTLTVLSTDPPLTDPSPLLALWSGKTLELTYAGYVAGEHEDRQCPVYHNISGSGSNYGAVRGCGSNISPNAGLWQYNDGGSPAVTSDGGAGDHYTSTGNNQSGTLSLVGGLFPFPGNPFNYDDHAGNAFVAYIANFTVDITYNDNNCCYDADLEQCVPGVPDEDGVCTPPP